MTATTRIAASASVFQTPSIARSMKSDSSEPGVIVIPCGRSGLTSAARRFASVATASVLAPDWRTIAMLAAAFVANALLIEPLGWVFSGAILFWGSAFALGSRHYVRDAVIAFTLSIGSFYLFALGLGIVLPPGVLRGIL